MPPVYFARLETHAAGLSDIAIRGAFSRLIKLHQDFLGSTANARSNRDLSEQGRTKEGRAILGKRAWEVIRAESTAQRLNARIDEKRAKIQLPAIERTDFAGAALRSQVRDRLNGKSAKEIRALVPTMSPLYLQTLLEAPELINVDRETVEVARDRLIEITNPGKLAELDAERDAVRLLANATAELSKAARELAGLPTAHALTEFLNQAVPDQRHIEAAIESELAA